MADRERTIHRVYYPRWTDDWGSLVRTPEGHEVVWDDGHRDPVDWCPERQVWCLDDPTGETWAVVP